MRARRPDIRAGLLTTASILHVPLNKFASLFSANLRAPSFAEQRLPL